MKTRVLLNGKSVRPDVSVLKGDIAGAAAMAREMGKDEVAGYVEALSPGAYSDGDEGYDAALFAAYIRSSRYSVEVD